MKPRTLLITFLFISLFFPQPAAAVATEWQPRLALENPTPQKESRTKAKKAKIRKKLERRMDKLQSKKPILGEVLGGTLLLVFGILAAVFLLIGLIGILSILFFFLAALAVLAAVVVVAIES